MNAHSLTRRQVFPMAAGLALSGPAALLARDEAPKQPAPKTTGEILRLLREGNQRFAQGKPIHPGRTPEDFQRLAEGQNPLAVIVGCADSRVTPDVVFDQGIGDLFVVRVAGNVVGGAGTIVKGSIEYAVAELNVAVIVVLGHSKCGAIKAALKHIDDNDPLPGAIAGLVDLIKPVVAKVKDQPGDRLENAIKANVAAGVERITGLPPILADRVKQGKVKVVGAVYDLKSGRVVFIE